MLEKEPKSYIRLKNLTWVKVYYIWIGKQSWKYFLSTSTRNWKTIYNSVFSQSKQRAFERVLHSTSRTLVNDAPQHTKSTSVAYDKKAFDGKILAYNISEITYFFLKKC